MIIDLYKKLTYEYILISIVVGLVFFALLVYNDVVPFELTLNFFLFPLFILPYFFLVNTIFKKTEICHESNNLALLLLLPLMAFYDQFQYFPLLSIANIALVVQLLLLFKIYNKTSGNNAIFFSGFLTGIAGVIYLPYIIFFPLNILMINQLKTVSWRDVVIYLFGLLSPVYVALSLIFIIYGSFEVIYGYTHYPIAMSLGFIGKGLLGVYKFMTLELLVIIVAMIVAIISFIPRYVGSIVKTRKMWNVIFFYLLAHLLIVIYDTGYLYNFFAAVVFPGFTISAIWMYNTKYVVTSKILVLVLYLGMIGKVVFL